MSKSPVGKSPTGDSPTGKFSTGKVSLLVDTNVWIDFFIDRGVNHDPAVTLIAAARAQGVPLFSSIETTKDVFFAVASELKRMQREETGAVTEAFALAANEAAWSCLSALRRQAIIVPADSSDMVEAMVQRVKHGDYEDNLVIAAAMRVSASYIVSSDRQLQRCSPVPCIGIAQAIEVVSCK